MKIKNLLSLGALTALTLTSCKYDNDLNSDWKGKYGVTFVSTIKGMAVSRASGTIWQQDDQLGIFMATAGSGLNSGSLESNKRYVASNKGELNPAGGEGLFYPAMGNVDFYAYYPYQSTLSNGQYAINVADQSKLENIDLLYASTKNVENGKQDVALQFTHQLSYIELNLQKDASLVSLEGIGVKLSGLSTEGTCNLADGSITTKGSIADITMNVSDDGTKAEAIVIPTTDLSNVKFVFTMFGRTFEQAFSDIKLGSGNPITSLAGGHHIVIPVKVSSKSGLIAVQMGNGNITDWTTEHAGDIEISFGEEEMIETTLINESFAAEFGVFTANTIDKGSLTKDLIFIDTKQKYAKINAYIGSGKMNPASGRIESGLVDLSKATSATLTFTNAINFANNKPVAEILKLQVQKEGEATWTDVTIPTEGLGTGENWTFKDATVDLSAFVGSKIKIGFLYTSDDTHAPATVEIKNVVLKAMAPASSTPEEGNNNEGTTENNGGSGNESGTGNEGETVTPVVETLYSETFGTVTSKTEINKFTAWDLKDITYTDPLQSGNTTYTFFNKTKNLDSHIFLSGNTSSEVRDCGFKMAGLKTEGYKNLQLTFDLMPNKDADLNILKFKYNGNNDLSVPSNALKGSTSAYTSVTITLPDNITDISILKQLPAEDQNYFRIDNLKITGEKKQ